MRRNSWALENGGLKSRQRKIAQSEAARGDILTRAFSAARVKDPRTDQSQGLDPCLLTILLRKLFRMFVQRSPPFIALWQKGNEGNLAAFVPVILQFANLQSMKIATCLLHNSLARVFTISVRLVPTARCREIAPGDR